jgi:hypothetical protein
VKSSTKTVANGNSVRLDSCMKRHIRLRESASEAERRASPRGRPGADEPWHATGKQG